ncbi:hypothetical protein D3C87_1269130 [compost metagenome]
MNKQVMNLGLSAAAVVLLLAAACSKKNVLTEQEEVHKATLETLSNEQTLAANGDTLLNVTYESGTTNSGIAGVNPTNATATDAAYMIGLPGTYRIAHKVTLASQVIILTRLTVVKVMRTMLQMHVLCPAMNAGMSLCCY